MPTSSITVLKYPPFKLPPSYLVVDGSLWDDHINVDDFIQGGVVAVILGLYKYYDKYGNVIGLHPNCKRILDQLAKSSLITMTYYFYWTDRNPEAEADWFLWAMQGYDVKFAWLDAEDNITIQTPQVRSEMYRRFAARVKAGFEPFGVYTNVGYMVEWAPDMNKWVGKYPAWIPQYGYPQPPGKTVMTWDILKQKYLPQVDPNYVLKVANGQTNVVGHQFTSYPIVPGFYNAYNVGLPTDVNLFSKDFIESLGVPMPTPEICPCCLQVIPEDPDPPPTAFNYVVKTGYNPNVRYPYSFSDPPIGIVTAGTKLLIDNTSDPSYAHFTSTSAGTFPQGGWVYKSFVQPL